MYIGTALKTVKELPNITCYIYLRNTVCLPKINLYLEPVGILGQVYNSNVLHNYVYGYRSKKEEGESHGCCTTELPFFAL